jgi:Fe-Mn family superoxide dismutase
MTNGHIPHRVKPVVLSGLAGIADETLKMHLSLYEGYVKETNNLAEKISEVLSDGRVDQDELPAYSELKLRLGFEYNGMKVHEYYFSNLTRGGGGDPARTSPFIQATTASVGSYERWKVDFVGVGKMRGVGWAICDHDPSSGRLSNHWVTLHETGHIAGFAPVLVMDVWEHAFLPDYSPSERPKYIEALFSNIDWNAVESRLRGRGSSRGVEKSHYTIIGSIIGSIERRRKRNGAKNTRSDERNHQAEYRRV